MLSAPSAAALADELAWLSERSRALAHAGNLGWLAEHPPFSPPVAEAWLRAMSAGRSFVFRLGLGARRREKADAAFEPRHVPQLLWGNVFDDLFASLIPRTSRDAARGFCSMALVKLSGSFSWAEAGDVLGLDPRSSQRSANGIVSRITAGEAVEPFRHSLTIVADRLAAESRPIDYMARREKLSNLRTIEAADWRTICEGTDVVADRKARSRGYAATWLWEYLTEGDYRLAPALQGSNPDNLRDVYRRFRIRDLPALRAPLEAYGEELLRRPASRV